VTVHCDYSPFCASGQLTMHVGNFVDNLNKYRHVLIKQTIISASMRYIFGQARTWFVKL